MMRFERIIRSIDEDVPAHIYRFSMKTTKNAVLRKIVDLLKHTYYVDNVPNSQDPIKNSSVNMLIICFTSESRGSSYIVMSIPATKYNDGEFLLNLAADIISTVNTQLLAYGET